MVNFVVSFYVILSTEQLKRTSLPCLEYRVADLNFDAWLSLVMVFKAAKRISTIELLIATLSRQRDISYVKISHTIVCYNIIYDKFDLYLKKNIVYSEACWIQPACISRKRMVSWQSWNPLWFDNMHSIFKNSKHIQNKLILRFCGYNNLKFPLHHNFVPYE